MRWTLVTQREQRFPDGGAGYGISLARSLPNDLQRSGWVADDTTPPSHRDDAAVLEQARMKSSTIPLE